MSGDEPNTSAYAKETQTLPSGLRVRIQIRADPRRPWEIHGTHDRCLVRRDRLGDSSSHEYFRGGRPLPLEMSERDARVLVELLNAAMPARPTRTNPTGWR